MLLNEGVQKPLDKINMFFWRSLTSVKWLLLWTIFLWNNLFFTILNSVNVKEFKSQRIWSFSRRFPWEINFFFRRHFSLSLKCGQGVSQWQETRNVSDTKSGILFPTSSFHIAQAIFNQDSNSLDFSRTFFILILRQGYFRECKFLYISFNQINHIYLNYIETDAIQIVRIRLL